LTNIGASNGLLRQYFPKGTDQSVHLPQRLLEVAHELNARPRKTLGWITPADAMQRLVLNPERPIVATTA
jgi:IS30 family transposase